MAKHGRRSGAAAEQASSGGSKTSQQNETVFKLQVNPPDDNTFVVKAKLLHNEYATRYLETIGVKPTPSTLAMVHKSIPLTDSCVKTTLRSKGHISDTVHMTVPPVQHNFRVPQVISALSLVQLGCNNQEDKERKAERPASVATPPAAHYNAGAHAGHLHSGPEASSGSGGVFQSLAARFLHPFNMDSSLAKQNIERIRLKHQQELHSAGDDSSDDETGNVDDTSSSGGSLLADLQEELVQELVVTPELVLTVLTPLEAALLDWYRAQAAETLKDRLSKEEFQATVELLSNTSTINFFATTINFLHEEFIKSSPMYSKELELKVASDMKMSRQGSRPIKTALTGAGRPSMIAPSRPIALQQYDLGYRLFVDERVARMNEDRAEGPRRSLLQKAGQLRAPAPSTFQCRSMSSFGAGSEGDELLSMAIANNDDLDGPAGPPGLLDRASVSSVFARPRQSHGPPAGPSSGFGLERSSVSSAYAGRPRPSHARRDLFANTAADDFLQDRDGNPLLQDAPMAVRRSIRHLSSAAALSSAALARTVLESLGPEDMDYLQQTRLFALQKEFAALYKKQRQERAGLFFCLPIFLLFLRLAVSTLFSCMYSLWSKTADGVNTLEEMDATLVQMLDPHGYLQRNLSLVQSTPAAVQVLAKYPHKSHEPERTHFSDVSPLLRAALPDPSSAAARRIMASAAKTKDGMVRTELTAAQREALYQDARKMAATRNTNLRKIGEPVQHTTRDSWIAKPDS